MGRPMERLLIEARWALDIASQGDLGERLGASRRTGQRWERGQAHPTGPQLHELARLVHPKNAALAAELAAACGTTVQALGLVPPPAPAAPPPTVPGVPLASVQVDSLVLTAADAMDTTSRVVRPVLYAAFARARQLRLTVEQVEEILRPVEASKGKAPPAKG
jgi:DNA-binding XRE family transcriptional regulator